MAAGWLQKGGTRLLSPISLPKGSRAAGGSGLAAERGDKAAESYIAAERAVRLLVAAGWLQKGGGQGF